jgi:ABC-type lipoprotein export system ATPase subunit
MFKVQRVEIDGFWGNCNLQTNLHDDVNIFIGRNGSGKTTFINFLEATLTADMELLASLQFKEIRLWLKNDKKRRKISIIRTRDVTYDKLLFKIGTEHHELLLLPREIEYRRKGIHPKYIDAINQVRSSLIKIINISWLSVHRELLEDEYRDPYTRRTSTEKNPVDRRIEDLTKRFTRYQLQLQSEINKLSDDFRKQVLASMLYSQEFDTFHTKQEVNLDFKSVKDGLMRTYSDLGALDTQIEKRIGEHISRIEKSVNAFREYKNKKGGILVDDILPLSLLSRTQHILNLSTDVEKKKNDILNPVNVYLNILRKFAEDKEFSLNPDLSGELLISKGKIFLPLEQLSSGEKQLFILLTEALLQKGQRFVFIADEPELSLHIEWQKEVLASIWTLNPNSQIIVATHAPQIAGGWRDRIIRMEEIIHE